MKKASSRIKRMVKNDPTAKCQLSEDVNDDCTTFSVLIHCWTAKINFHLIIFLYPILRKRSDRNWLCRSCHVGEYQQWTFIRQLCWHALRKSSINLLFSLSLFLSILPPSMQLTSALDDTSFSLWMTDDMTFMIDILLQKGNYTLMINVWRI